jgi:hypothetical protein
MLIQSPGAQAPGLFFQWRSHVSDEESVFQLAQRIGPALLRLRAVTDRFKIDVDDAVVLLILGAMNVNRKGVVALWSPVSIDEFFANLTDCPRDRIRLQLRKLKARGLVISNADGFVVSDMHTWRTVAEALTDAANVNATEPIVSSDLPPHEGVLSGLLLQRLVEAVESIDRKLPTVPLLRP